MKEEQEAVLSLAGCETAAFWMIEFIQGMLNSKY